MFFFSSGKSVTSTTVLLESIQKQALPLGVTESAISLTAAQ
jgi:hypothetical protein